MHQFWWQLLFLSFYQGLLTEKSLEILIWLCSLVVVQSWMVDSHLPDQLHHFSVGKLESVLWSYVLWGTRPAEMLLILAVVCIAMESQDATGCKILNNLQIALLGFVRWKCIFSLVPRLLEDVVWFQILHNHVHLGVQTSSAIFVHTWDSLGISFDTPASVS